MNHAAQAVLISGVVLPGLAQVQLGKPVRGYLLMAVVIGLVCAISINAVSLALEAMAPYTRSGVIPDPTLIYQAVHQAIYQSGEGWMNGALWLLLGCWLYAIIDGFMLGRAKDIALRADKGRHE